MILIHPSPVKAANTKRSTLFKEATEEAWTEIKSTFQLAEYKMAPTVLPVVGDDGSIKSKDNVF